MDALRGIRLRKIGRRLVGRCPRCRRFALSVNEPRRLFNCFGCGWGGPVEELRAETEDRS